MKRKLLILDVVLVAAVAWTGFRLHSESEAVKAREAATLNRRIASAPPPQFSPLPSTPAVLASGYAQIAQKMLFDRSRNPDVVVELPPPPPPKPMPPLPIYHGTMNLGDGPVAVMSATASSPHQEVRPGEAIGPFKLLGVGSEDIALEWDGKVIRRKIDQMLDRTVREVERSMESPAAAANAAPITVLQSPLGPGAETGRGFKACVPNDSTPAGAIVDGFRKSVNQTPFGQTCRWDPVTR